MSDNRQPAGAANQIGEPRQDKAPAAEIPAATQSQAIGETAASEAVPPPAAAPRAPEHPERLGRYRIVKPLGQGAMGAVYLAEDTELQRQVALKVPKFAQQDSPELMERFYREARSAATLHHPNICPVHDIGEDQGTRYITMGYISGPPLSNLVGTEKIKSERTVAKLVRKIALALAAAHAKGIVHRDLKPANILLDEHNEPVITDFGLARRMDSGPESRLTQDGTILGTPAYMSPEQVLGDPVQMGPLCDVYALGVILYELLTGQLPYRGSITAVLGQIIQGKPKRPSELRPDVDPQLEAICQQLMAHEPQQRYASAAEAATALGRWLEGTRGPVLQTGQDGLQNRPTAAATAVRGFPTPHRGATEGVPDAASDPVAGRPAVGARGSVGRPATAQVGRPATAQVGRPATAVSPRLLIAGGLLVALLGGGIWLGVVLLRVKDKDGQMVAEVKVPDGGTAEIMEDGKVVAESPAKPAQPGAGASSLANPTQGATRLLDLGNRVTLELVGIPPGEFPLGSTPEEQAWALQNGAMEQDVKLEGREPRKAHIKSGFWFGCTEVTVGQWKQFAAATNYQTDAEKTGRSWGQPAPGKPNDWVEGANWKDPQFGAPPQDSHAVCCISWNDATAFCAWLSQGEQQAGRLPAGCVVRLPTEAEWEYACRAGTPTRFWWGDSPEDAKGRLNWSSKDDGYAYVAPVDAYGEHGRNGFGLADMLGNVSEWCLDDLDVTRPHEEYFHGNWRRVVRGFGFGYRAGSYRCACRRGENANRSSSNGGFRVCLGANVTGAKSTPIVATAPDAAFLKEVAALSAEQQVARVVAKLKELNPDFDTATANRKIENGQVTDFMMDARGVLDVSPMRALVHLKKFNCQIPVDLKPSSKAAFGDLSPLQGLMLENVSFAFTQVADLTPLKGMPLKSLSGVSQLRDLEILRGFQLQKLSLNGNKPPLTDLTPLRGMPLEFLAINESAVTDLSPLQGMKLTTLHFGHAPVRDLSPAQGMPLNSLCMTHTKIEDLSPLKGMPLVRIMFDPPLLNIGRNREILHSISTLESINNLPAAEFWKQVEAGEAPKP